MGQRDHYECEQLRIWKDVVIASFKVRSPKSLGETEECYVKFKSSQPKTPSRFESDTSGIWVCRFPATGGCSSEVHVSVMFTELSATALTHIRSPRLWQNMSQWSKVGTYQSQSSDHQQVSRMLLLFTYVTQTDSQNNKYVSIYCR